MERLAVIRRVLLVVLGVAIASAAVELGLRFVFSPDEIDRYIASPVPAEQARWTDHPFFPFVGVPNATYELQVPVNGKDVTIDVRNNSYGFRSHELPEAKSPADYFIVALGESTTWGSAAESNATTWPELLEARLRARYPQRNVQVFNFGTQNVTLPYSVAALALIATHIEPDLILVYHGYNEWAPSTARNYRVDHSHFYRKLAFSSRWAGVQRSIPRWMLRSYAAVYLSARVDELIGVNSLGHYVEKWRRFDDSLDEAGLERVLTREWQNLRTIDALARRSNARVLFSTFQFYDGKDRHHQLINETLRRFYADHGFDYVDQDALIPDHDRTFQYDVCHFTRAGDELMAENFFKRIVEEGLLGR